MTVFVNRNPWEMGEGRTKATKSRGRQRDGIYGK